MNEIRAAMQKSVDHFVDQVKSLRFGGVTPALVDTISVIYYGQNTPIKHLAHTSKIDAGVSVSPFDVQMTGPICTALQAAGFSAYQFSKTNVIVSVPPPSGEEKERVRKRIRELAEEARVSIRQIRKKFKRQREVSDRSDEKKLQALTDDMIAQIDELAQIKMESI